YYQAIDWAVANGLTHFDAGSGNARHKQRRGFPAVENYSLHRFYNVNMQLVWDENITRVNQDEALRIKHINRELGNYRN
ncbi:MAG: peptidogalycan biosysnthesis protein, partial [Acidobacteriota bacterium]|nr:peptidogalycan biosysnthesis protein [Acidobacteriota bacterium]